VKIGTKLISGFLGVAAILVIVAIITGVLAQRAIDTQDRMVDDYEKLGEINELTRSIYEEFWLATRYLIMDDPVKAATLLEEKVELHEENVEGFGKLREGFSEESEYTFTFAKIEKNIEAAYELFVANIARKDSIVFNPTYSATALGELADTVVIGTGPNDEDGLDYVIASISEEIEESKEYAEASLDSAKSISLIAGIVATILALVMGITVSRSITNPIHKLTASADKISEGDLDTPIPEINTKDEIQNLAQAMAIFSETVNGSLKVLKESK